MEGTGAFAFSLGYMTKPGTIYSGGQGPDPSTLSPEPRSFDLGEHTVPEPVCTSGPARNSCVPEHGPQDAIVVTRLDVEVGKLVRPPLLVSSK